MYNKLDFSRLKQEINLPEYAAHLGYELDKKKSTRNSLVMSDNHVDKIIISKPTDIWVYFSVYDDSDNGTIIDFAKNRSNKSLFEIGKELENWLGTSQNITKRYTPNTKENKFDPGRIQRLFNYCHPIISHSYLRRRGICEKILRSKRFYGRAYRDQFGNAVFPHFKRGIISGLELVDENIHLFVRGSEKTLWRSNRFMDDDTLIIAETPIDAISYQILHALSMAFYIATCGGFSNRQAEIIRRLVAELDWIKKIILITDNDKGGDKIYSRLKKVIRGAGFSGSLKRHSPKKRGCDWNDVLVQMGI